MALAIGECQSHAIQYGQCISANFKDVERGMCERQFQAFKSCVTRVMKKKW